MISSFDVIHIRNTMTVAYYNDLYLAVSPAFSVGPPGPPGVVIVEEITESTATLSWSPATDNHSPISSYNLQARSPFSLGWQIVKTGKRSLDSVTCECSILGHQVHLLQSSTQDHLPTAKMYYSLQH